MDQEADVPHCEYGICSDRNSNVASIKPDNFAVEMPSTVSQYYHNVTPLHLTSKEFQRIHLPCIPQHGETSKCTLVYIEMYPGKVVVLLKEQATFIKARIVWMWMVCPISFYTSSDNN